MPTAEGTKLKKAADKAGPGTAAAKRWMSYVRSKSPAARTGRSRTPKGRSKSAAPRSKSRSASAGRRKKARSTSTSRYRQRGASYYPGPFAARYYTKKSGGKTLKKGKQAPWPYKDVPARLGGVGKFCYLRRYHDKNHVNYVPKATYYRSCGYKEGAKKWDPAIRRQHIDAVRALGAVQPKSIRGLGPSNGSMMH